MLLNSNNISKYIFFAIMKLRRITMKKIILLLLALSFIAPVLADEINLTPKNSFSGFNNNGIRSKYPQLQKTVSASDIIEEQNDKVINRKSVREMGLTSPVNTGSTPMTYDQFPKNYDSSNSMMLMQGGMQNMFMGY